MKPASRVVVVICLALLVIGSTCWGQATEPQLIESTRVVGNDYIPKEGILDEVKGILQPGQPYTPEVGSKARDAVLAMGYFDDVQVTTEAGERGIVVVIRVVEKQRIQKIVFVGNTVVNDQQLGDVIFTRVGHVVDDRIIRRDVRRIEDFYDEKGYIAKVTQAPVNQFGVLTFVIEEDRIEDVLIEGLKRTDPEVIKRLLTVKPGQLYQKKAILEDMQRIFNEGIFNNVTPDIRPGIKDPQRGIIVVFVIEEKRTGQASVAAGYSSLDKFVLVLSLSENNFRGKGQRVSANIELFGRTSYELSFFEPYLDAKGTSFSARVYDTESRRRFISGAALNTASDTFDERRKGGTFSVSRPMSATTRGSLRFRSEVVSSSYFQATRTIDSITSQQNNNYNPPNHHNQNTPPDNPNLNPDIPEPGDIVSPVVVAAPLHPGGRLTSLAFGWSRDTRDILADPTAGSYTSLDFEEAGSIFGGEVNFRKLQAEQRWFYQLKNKRDVIALRLMGGLSMGSLPLFESYSVGGANTLRGYQEDAFRGNSMVLANLEFRRPISREGRVNKLTAVGFIDVGDAFGGAFPTVVPGFEVPADDASLKLHVGVGAGLRVVTPIGPIRLDFGWGSEGSQAHFSFGHTF